jgi:hypothetical protein
VDQDQEPGAPGDRARDADRFEQTQFKTTVAKIARATCFTLNKGLKDRGIKKDQDGDWRRSGLLNLWHLLKIVPR